MKHYSAAEQRIRLLVLERDDYCCVCCGRSVEGQFYSIGHRLREGQGGRYCPTNLLTFLGTGSMGCHFRIDSRRDPHDEAKGYTVRSWQDPAGIGVMVFGESGSGVTKWPTADGRWADYPPEEMAS